MMIALIVTLVALPIAFCASRMWEDAKYGPRDCVEVRHSDWTWHTYKNGRPVN